MSLNKIENNKKLINYFSVAIQAIDTFLKKPDNTTSNKPFIRDSIDLKRYMVLVVFSLIPCLIFGIYNVGRNSYLSINCNEFTFIQAFSEGLIHVLPLIIISYTVGGFFEFIFAQIRNHELSEGFLVTGLLYPLICPPTIPWWIFAIGIAFGVIIGKEIYGGVGHNILNPALTARTFLFFSYPAFMSGDIWTVIPIKKLENGIMVKSNWTLIDDEKINFFLKNNLNIDNTSSPTFLSIIKSAQEGVEFSIQQIRDIYPLKSLLLGFTPGSIGETSVIMCALGGIFLLITRIASWRVILGVFLGAIITSTFFNIMLDVKLNNMLNLSTIEHIAIGGFCFGAIFMATDPVSGPLCNESKFIYGLLIGILCIVIRLFNPAFPEGMMLSILFMNIFSPLLDNIIINKKGLNK